MYFSFCWFDCENLSLPSHFYYSHFRYSLVRFFAGFPLDFLFHFGTCPFYLFIFKQKPNSQTPCRCNNPLTGKPYNNAQDPRQYAFEVTKRIAENASTTLGDRLDVVLLGDSIMERWNGIRFGKPHDDGAVFKQLLTRAGGGDIDAVALGVSGDLVRIYLIYLSVPIFPAHHHHHHLRLWLT